MTRYNESEGVRTRTFELLANDKCRNQVLDWEVKEKQVKTKK